VDPEHEKVELLKAIKSLAALIEQSDDLPKIYEYIGRLNQLRTKLARVLRRRRGLSSR